LELWCGSLIIEPFSQGKLNKIVWEIEGILGVVGKLLVSQI